MQISSQDITVLKREARERALGLRELRYFLNVAQTGNIGRAALALNVSQSVISVQLRKLEQGLGTQLLLRHGRGMTLTAAGACLRDRANTAMQLLSLPLASPAPCDVPQTISLAVTSEMGGTIGPLLAKMFQARWPQLRLVIQEGRGLTLEEWVIHRHVDVAILEDPPALAELELIPVLTDNLCVIGPVHSDMGRDPWPLPVRELNRYSLILPREQHWLRRRLDQATQQRGVRLSPVLEVDSISVIKTLVRGGLGCSVLPNAAIEGEARRGALAFRAIGQPSLVCNSFVAFHRGASGSRIAAFAGMVRDAMTALAKDGAWPGARLIHAEAA